jgi:hypothetical protein
MKIVYLCRPMLPAAPEESAVITRRECVIGLVVVALCVLGFVVFRPHFADAHPSQERVIDRRAQGRLDSRLVHRVRTIRFVRSSLRVLDDSRFEPDHFVPAGLELRIEREKAEQEAP